jgi:GTPase
LKQNNQRHSGYIALIGRTNVGKSTFLNAIMETKVAIVSDKPQTTRKRILGIKTTGKGQMIFFDSPGVHKPHFKLNERMMNEVEDALLESDLILYFVGIDDDREDEFLLSMIKRSGKPVFLIINKIDKYSKAKALERIQFFKDIYGWKEIVPISAKKGDNMDVVEGLIYDNLPAGDDFFPAEQWTSQTENYYVAELIRENLLRWIRDELPFITGVKIEEIKDRGETVYIRADIYVETHSQKKIIVGSKGGMIKQVGQETRRELENYFSKKVYIDLFVKIVPDWRNSPQVITEILG